jgi:hypothetical protein
MSIFRSEADGSDPGLDCPRARLITSPRAARSMGDWITLEDGRTAKIVKIERKSDT